VVVVAEAVLRLLRVLATNGALVVLEDLHWADLETLAVVEYLTDNLGSEPVVCLGTARSEGHSAVLDLAHAFEARRVAKVVELSRLPDEAVDAMAQACLDGEAVPDKVRDALRDWTDGLPLLVEDVLATLVASGSLVRGRQGWAVAGALEPVVPLTFAAAVQRRLEALGEDTTRAIRAAAVLGRRFEWPLLPSVAGLDETLVLSCLRSAVDAQLVGAQTEGGGSGLWFRHALTRDAVVAGLLPPERAELCRRALVAVEAGHPGLPGTWCELGAELAEGAGDRERAAALLREAGQRALAQGALATAEATLERALQAADGTERRAEIRQTLTEVLSLAGRTDRVFAVGKELLADLQTMSAPADRVAEVHLSLARAAAAAGRWEQGHGHIERSRHAAGPLAEEGLLCRIDALAAHVAIGCGETVQADALARAALAAAERARLPEVACEALEVIGRCARLSNLAEAEAAFGRALRIADEHALVVCRIRALHELGTVDLLNADPLDRLFEARELAQRAGALATCATIDLQIASRMSTVVDIDRMLEAALRCVDAARRFRLDLPLAAGLCFVAYAFAHRGQRPEMEAAISDALDLAPDNADVVGVAWWARATLALIEENRAEALEALDASMRGLRSSAASSPTPSRAVWALIRTIEDADGAAAREEVRASGAIVFRIIRGYVGYADAIAAGRDGLPQEAESAFGRAEADMVMYPWFRHLGLRLVAETAVRDGWGDPVGWARQAGAFFETAGLDRIASACRSILRQAGAPVPRKGRGVAEVPADLRALGVSSREMDVLLLVGQGLSNAAIGERLFLSARTVESHVATLKAKTGADSRARLIVLAASRR
jgi:DNA-binding CsgD family transcriptional regulator/tetratricopeptide (TPR) repeat protein